MLLNDVGFLTRTISSAIFSTDGFFITSVDSWDFYPDRSAI
jgi:hypothetical protein